MGYITYIKQGTTDYNTTLLPPGHEVTISELNYLRQNIRDAAI